MQQTRTTPHPAAALAAQGTPRASPPPGPVVVRVRWGESGNKGEDTSVVPSFLNRKSVGCFQEVTVPPGENSDLKWHWALVCGFAASGLLRAPPWRNSDRCFQLVSKSQGLAPGGKVVQRLPSLESASEMLTCP